MTSTGISCVANPTVTTTATQAKQATRHYPVQATATTTTATSAAQGPTKQQSTTAQPGEGSIGGLLQRIATELGLFRREQPQNLSTSRRIRHYSSTRSTGSTTKQPTSHHQQQGGGAGSTLTAGLMPPTSRSSVSSIDSGAGDGFHISMSKRWTTLETVGRCMFVFSVAFFIIGVLITVFGFSNTGINPSHQVPLQVLGPACLTMTIIMWIVGCIFSRLWNLEWKRQQQALELRDRVQLHALAMDILNNPVISPSMLHDPRMRRQLLLKLRAQRAIDLRSVPSSTLQHTPLDPLRLVMLLCYT